MLYLGCHLWMKLLKLSVQSIVLLYQLLVREQKKKSRLRSVDGQLLLVLAPSCASISKNSLAFNFHIFWRCHLSPTEIGWFEGSVTSHFIWKEIFPTPPYTCWFPCSQQGLLHACSQTAPVLLPTLHASSQWESLVKAAFQGYYCFHRHKGERKIRSVSNTCTLNCMESSLEALFCSFSISCNILCSSCCFDSIISVSLLCKLWISLSLATSLFCTSAAETSGFKFRSTYLNSRGK